jgi:hypothetical protein
MRTKLARCFGSRGFAGLVGLVVVCCALSSAATPTLPNINTNNVIIITNPPYNAAGDGITDNTLAISTAIAQASQGGKTNNLWGGTVRIPGPGIFLSGPLTLMNNVNIQVDSGATLQMEPLAAWTNYPAQNQTYGNLLYASGLTNLEISGSGTIDGQGGDWWAATNSVFNNRPYMVFFNGNCGRVFIRDVTLQNPPTMHVVFKGADNDITVQHITINTTAANAANTDGIDLVGTNCLVQDSSISAGDDNIALGSSSASAVSAGIVITNCAFGKGHGVSIGSNTAGGVSNLTVVNCTFDGTDYGIRMKSNDATTGGSGRGGIAQNLNYYNIGMTNITKGAVVIYSYYASGGQFGTPTGVSPYFASTQAVDVTTIPVWQDINISNVTATVAAGGVPGIVWGRMEVPVTNLVFNHVNISGPKAFDIYNAQGVQFIDCQVTPPASSNTFLLYNAQVTISNSAPSASLVTFDGLSTNGYVNSLALYNGRAALQNTNIVDPGLLTLGGGSLVVSNNLNLGSSSAVSFVLGTNPSTINVLSNLALSGTVNITAGAGFTNASYTLFTYSNNLTWGPPSLSGTPGGMLYHLNTNVAGQVQAVPALLTVSNLNDSGPGSLRQQIQNAQSNDTIVFASGLGGTITLTNGQLQLAYGLTIIGPGPDKLALKGNGDRIFTVGPGTSLITGLCITNGRPPAGFYGGGVAVYPSTSLVLSNCWVMGNSTLTQGGGLFNFGTLIVWNSLIANNTAAISNGEADGGGIYNSQGTLFVWNSTITSNAAVSSATGSVFGGALYNSGGTCVFRNCTICSNVASCQLGSSGVGAGLFNATNAAGGTVFLTNCTVAFNRVAGALASGSAGGGIYATQVVLAGCIVAKNTASTGPDVNGMATSGGYNLIGTATSVVTGLTNGVQHDQVGSSASPLDPLLAGLQSNGGPVPTLALKPGSPAIDQGNSFGLVSDARGAPRPFDFPFIPNAPGGDGSDIGAFEAASPVLQIDRVATNVVLSWPFYYGNFSLLITTNLGASNGWVTAPGAQSLRGNELAVTNGIVPGSRLYRLKAN